MKNCLILFLRITQKLLTEKFSVTAILIFFLNIETYQPISLNHIIQPVRCLIYFSKCSTRKFYPDKISV